LLKARAVINCDIKGSQSHRQYTDKITNAHQCEFHFKKFNTMIYSAVLDTGNKSGIQWFVHQPFTILGDSIYVVLLLPSHFVLEHFIRKIQEHQEGPQFSHFLVMLVITITVGMKWPQQLMLWSIFCCCQIYRAKATFHKLRRIEKSISRM
jgi:hypothetical protein